MSNARTPMFKEGSSLNVQTEKVKRGLSAEFRFFATYVVLTDVSRKGAKSQRGSIPKISMLCDFAPLRESSLTNPVFSRNGGEPEIRNHAHALVLSFEPQPLGFLDLDLGLCRSSHWAANSPYSPDFCRKLSDYSEISLANHVSQSHDS